MALGSGGGLQDPPAATRAAEVHALREAKNRELNPPDRSRVERFLFKIEDDLVVERWLNPPRGLYLRLGGSARLRFWRGSGYRYSSGAFDFRVSAAASMRRYAIGEPRCCFLAP
jgi:hypothetical protein